MEAKIVSEQPISLSELKAEINKVKSQEKEPSIRVTKVEDYLNSISPLAREKEKELVEAIKKLNVPRLKDQYLVKIADMVPQTLEDLKVIMQGYAISISADNMKKIVETANKVLKQD